MSNYLLEIGTEELPANQVSEAQGRLHLLMSEALIAARLSFQEIKVSGTPRRTACQVMGLSARQETMKTSLKGPPLKSSFDAAGKPLPAALGFARKQGLSVEQLDRQEIAGVVYLMANLTIEGKPVESVLPEIIPGVIEEISGERLMRWGSSALKFSRPVRWLVSLLDNTEVEISLDGIVSGRQTMGHRILAPGPVNIASAESYIEDLRKAFVLASPEQRRQVIVEAVAAGASSVAGHARQVKGALLDEVVNITEWPSAIVGEFAPEYLDLPDTLIETVMIHHQRYFPVESEKSNVSSGSKLLPYFISIANNDRLSARSFIKQGNERVLRARLADGRFFYFDDQKTPLRQRSKALSQLTYHEGLGSYLDKQERLVKAGNKLAGDLGLDKKQAACLERTFTLCKLDLVTNLVRELPELQGYVGSWYAQAEGEPPDVVAAIASHYSPRSPDDAIPQDKVGMIASLVDKLDNLVCLFAAGKRPSGSSDPYILRRQAQALIDIAVDGLPEYRINITAAAEELLQILEPRLNANKRWLDGQAARKGMADLREFLLQRVKLKLSELTFKREVIEAAMAAGDPLGDPGNLLVRLRCLSDLISSDGGLDLVRAGVRIGKILTAESSSGVKTHLFDNEYETELYQLFNKEVVKVWQKDGNLRLASSASDYKELLSALSKIAPSIDRFFEQVMVNDPDLLKRKNRHALLKDIDCYFRLLADFPRMQPLLP